MGPQQRSPSGERRIAVRRRLAAQQRERERASENDRPMGPLGSTYCVHLNSSNIHHRTRGWDERGLVIGAIFVVPSSPSRRRSKPVCRPTTAATDTPKIRAIFPPMSTRPRADFGGIVKVKVLCIHTNALVRSKSGLRGPKGQVWTARQTQPKQRLDFNIPSPSGSLSRREVPQPSAGQPREMVAKGDTRGRGDCRPVLGFWARIPRGECPRRGLKGVGRANSRRQRTPSRAPSAGLGSWRRRRRIDTTPPREPDARGYLLIPRRSPPSFQIQRIGGRVLGYLKFDYRSSESPRGQGGTFLS